MQLRRQANWRPSKQTDRSPPNLTFKLMSAFHPKWTLDFRQTKPKGRSRFAIAMSPRRQRPQARGEAPATQPSTGPAAGSQRAPGRPAVLCLRQVLTVH